MLEDFRLKVFVAVATCRSFTKAAAALNITQPAVSQHISELEKSFGVKLFERQSQKIFVTPAGEMLIDYAQEIIDKYDTINQVFTRFPDRVVKVAASDEVFNYVSTSLL